MGKKKKSNFHWSNVISAQSKKDQALAEAMGKKCVSKACKAEKAYENSK